MSFLFPIHIDDYNTSRDEYMEDRAVGYLTKGKAKSVISNYGQFIEWDIHPPGLWNGYTYLPDVSFMMGVPGQSYSYRYDWFTSDDKTS